MLITIIIIFFILTFLSIPIGYVMGISGLIGVISIGGGGFFRILITRLHSGLNDHALIAIPFFILTAEVMNRSGVTKRLVDFANNIIGHVSGGLSHANILVSILFAGLTGTQVTDTVAIGKILIPAMKKEGFPASYSSAVTAASSVLGPIIPPSIVMIVYSTLIMEVSVRSLFIAGVMPGILMGLALLIISGVLSAKKSYPKRDRPSPKVFLKGLQRALLPLLTPIIILAPILLGIATITEASAIAALYSVFLGAFIYRSISFQDFWTSLIETAVFSGVIFLLIATSHLIGWYVTRAGLSRTMASFIEGYIGQEIIVLAMMNVLLLLVGMFIDVIPAAIILAPVLAPMLANLGFDYLHIAIVIIVNLNLGGITPPVGMTIMTSTKIAEVPYEDSVKSCAPFFAAHIAVLILITYFPEVVLWLPRLLGAWS